MAVLKTIAGLFKTNYLAPLYTFLLSKYINGDNVVMICLLAVTTASITCVGWFVHPSIFLHDLMLHMLP